MFASLRKLAALPGGTKICCGHEYTESNARFALSVDADNAALKARTEQAHQQRAAGQPTVPSTMASELAGQSVPARARRGDVRRSAREEGQVLT